MLLAEALARRAEAQDRLIAIAHRDAALLTEKDPALQSLSLIHI